MNLKDKESPETVTAQTVISNLVAGLYQVRKDRAALDRTEKVILAELKPLVDPKFDVLPEQSIVGDGIELTRSPGTNRTISAELLRCCCLCVRS